MTVELPFAIKLYSPYCLAHRIATTRFVALTSLPQYSASWIWIDRLLMDGLRRQDSASATVPVRSHGLALVADLEHAGFMPSILHGVMREGRVAVLCDRLGISPASGGYGLSAEAQLHRYALIRNIQGGSRRRYAADAREGTSSRPLER
jgi:hypothetical protein